MSGERLPIWDDEDVIEAMRNGRPLDDICVLNCPQCGRINYYNQGSSYYGKACDVGFYAAYSDELPLEDGVRYVIIDEVLTMDDVLDAECADYP